MKAPQRAAICALLSILACPAFASSKLTSQQCRDYPFVRSAQPPSHKQLENEISELESVGYNPATGDDNEYPLDLQSAEHKLQAKFRHDCVLSGNDTISSEAPPRNTTQR
ncbi:DUF4148 domain-containing protein [Paraburkholderia oxyphila]|uniref:DUF4148 domain-containing protein n=1 Tax=Paraburkholderia oxyphila TaxID=614212 RepID=UPI000A01274C|nr:DUF4148 domain-containing protein [Paraburkholderia oxyphila]